MRIYRPAAQTVRRVEIRDRRGVVGGIRFAITVADGSIHFTQQGSVEANCRVTLPIAFGYEVGAISAAPTSGITRIRKAPKSASDWIADNSDKLSRHAGKWVAVTSKGVIAAASSYDEVWAQSQSRGAKNPTVFKLPDGNQGPKVVTGHRRV